MDQLLAILQGQSQLVSFVLIGVAFFCVTWVLSNVARQLFSLYQKNFYQQVDKGLRDVVVMMEPGQIFTVTLIAAIVFVPLVFWITNIVLAMTLAVIIFVAPTFVLKVMKKRRSDDFVDQLPDALSSISSSLRSGLNLVKAFQQGAYPGRGEHVVQARAHQLGALDVEQPAQLDLDGRLGFPLTWLTTSVAMMASMMMSGVPNTI